MRLPITIPLTWYLIQNSACVCLCFLQNTPNLSNKRKSVHARKMRPPTVIGKCLWLLWCSSVPRGLMGVKYTTILASLCINVPVFMCTYICGGLQCGGSDMVNKCVYTCSQYKYYYIINSAKHQQANSRLHPIQFRTPLNKYTCSGCKSIYLETDRGTIVCTKETARIELLLHHMT